MGFVDNCGLTEEPAGGSPQPTETPRLLGVWVHTDERALALDPLGAVG